MWLFYIKIRLKQMQLQYSKAAKGIAGYLHGRELHLQAPTPVRLTCSYSMLLNIRGSVRFEARIWATFKNLWCSQMSKQNSSRRFHRSCTEVKASFKVGLKGGYESCPSLSPLQPHFKAGFNFRTGYVNSVTAGWRRNPPVAGIRLCCPMNHIYGI